MEEFTGHNRYNVLVSRVWNDMPIFPMNACSTHEMVGNPNFWAELKWDGRRGMIIRNEDGVGIWSRNMKDQVGKCPHLEKAFQNLPPGTMIDGEFVAMHEDKIEVGGRRFLRPDFTATANIMGSKAGRARWLQENTHPYIHFIAFDCPYSKYMSHCYWPLEKRREQMEAMLTLVDSEFVWSSPIWQEYDDKLLENVHEIGLEGLMFKNSQGVYDEGGRPGNNWYKYKFVEDKDVVVTDFTDGQGKYIDTIGAICYGQYREIINLDPKGFRTFDIQKRMSTAKWIDGKPYELIFRGQCSGMTDEVRYSILNRPEMGDRRDGLIGQVMTIKAMPGVPGSDKFRHPQFREWRDDKNPEECVWEKEK